MGRIIFAAIVAVCVTVSGIRVVHGARQTPQPAGHPAAPVIVWSNEARQAIVPAGANGIFGTENYGNKLPDEAAIYMGIVHATIYDTAVAIDGGYRPYAIAVTAPRDTSPEAAIATAVHRVLTGLQPALGLTPDQLAMLERRYSTYIAAIPEGWPKTNGISIGTQVALAVLSLRSNDGRESNPQIGDLNPPPPRAGVWDPGSAPAVGLRAPGIRPLALRRGSQFRPQGPTPLSSAAYAEDLLQVAELGRADTDKRGAEQTTQARFWTDHDLRQWNDGMLKLATERGLNLVQTARMLAMAHVSGGDAMIACFDAKYTYWFWRPYQAVPRAGEDSNPATAADPAWRPLGTTPNHPEYPSAHACHSTATATALQAFFGTDRVSFSLDSRITRTTRQFERFQDAIDDVNLARVLAGFHFFHSDIDGSRLGRRVARYVVTREFTPLE